MTEVQSHKRQWIGEANRPEGVEAASLRAATERICSVYCGPAVLCGESGVKTRDVAMIYLISSVLFGAGAAMIFMSFS